MCRRCKEYCSVTCHKNTAPRVNAEGAPCHGGGNVLKIFPETFGGSAVISVSQRVLIFAVGMAALSAAPVHASETLQFAPAGAWVHPILTPAEPDRKSALQPYATLNRSLQMRLSDQGDSTYWETLVKVQTPRGLAIARPTVEWGPDDDSIIINKVQLIRDGKVIDLLARGQTFTILRREPELEKAVMTGDLTAILEPDGVEVGDILDFAYTRVRHVAVRGARSELDWSNIGTGPTAKRDTRIVWPTAKPIRWRLSDDLPVPTVIHGPDESELILNLDTYKRPDDVEMAPKRYNRFGEMQFSQFASWSEVSALMAPYYDRAAMLDAHSPLKAEAAKIRAASPDPKTQAALALHLVQQKVRYNFANSTDGGDVPASAELTWLRRWGDCKAKTTLLVALLRDLGLTAVPALVDTDEGNGMNERLPGLALFDHVITRATIAGKVYWLDGTLTVDGGLDDVDPADEEWALPLTPAGEELQSILPAPLERPEVERRLTLDASKGFEGQIPAHAELITYGSVALRAYQLWQAEAPEDIDAAMPKFWKKTYPAVTFVSQSITFDAANNTLVFSMEGTTHVKTLASGAVRVYEVAKDDIGDDYEVPDRTTGAHKNAPVKIEYPSFTRSTTTVLLPDGGKGFGTAGTAIDRVLAGRELKRQGSFKDGAFTLVSSERTLEPEVPLADAQAAEAEMNLLSGSNLYLSGLAPVASGADAVSGSPAAAEMGEPEAPPVASVKPPKPAAPLPPAGDLTLKDLADFYAGQGR